MQLLLISKTTKKDNNSVGDIVGVFSDDHEFSEKELEKFTVITDIEQTVIDTATPEQVMAYKDSEGVWKKRTDSNLYALNYDSDNGITCNYEGEELS